MPDEHYSWKKILWVGLFFLVLAGIAGFLFFKKNQGVTPATDVPGATSNKLFPFGSGTPSENIPGSETPPATGEEAPQIPTGGSSIDITNTEDLRQLTNYPVTNFFPFVEQKTIDEPKFDEKTRTTITLARMVAIPKVRWNAKQTGMLYEAELGDTVITADQKTQTQSPAAEELWFANNGNTMLYRSWNDTTRMIDTYRGTLPAETTALTYCTASFTQNMKQGTKGGEVADLQKYINQKLSLTGVADGSFGPKTLINVKNIQKLLNVPESGETDQATLDAINTDCTQIRNAFGRATSEPVKLVGGTFIATDIARGTVSPDGKQLFYLLNDSPVSGILAKFDGGGQKKIFDSMITEWMPQWASVGTIAMTTLASRESDGYLYYLNPTNGSLKKVLGPIKGLTTLVSPDAKNVLYSESTEEGFTTHIYDTQTGVVRDVDIATLPAKCVWQDTTTIFCGVPTTIPSAQYPDQWYQGVVSFSDELRFINAGTGISRLIASPGQKTDAVKLQVSPDRKYLYFINRNDESLWSLNLN